MLDYILIILLQFFLQQNSQKRFKTASRPLQRRPHWAGGIRRKPLKFDIAYYKTPAQDPWSPMRGCSGG